MNIVLLGGRVLEKQGQRMKVSLKWLEDYVDVNLLPQELARKLTMAGLETGDIQVIGAGWEHIFIGEVTEISKHPNADRLQLVTVNVGQEQCTVVCGAPNIAVCHRVPFARVGARLYDGHTGKYGELKPAKIRGVHSAGMVCSEMELGISDNHEGIMILSEDAPVGLPLAHFMGDTILDMGVTPNRPDCLNMIGVAREIAALTGSSVHLPEAHYAELDVSTAELISIEILDPDLCPRYCGGIIKDVKIGPSPQWMQERLLSAGMRPINNIVDITNFVMLEYGQPLHAFDYEGISGHKIVVRRAREGEMLVTLDGEARQLSHSMLVIADEYSPIALAGVMGGVESEVTERTSTVLLESANFNNANIRRTSFGLGLVSEASSRFDKGLSTDLPLPAIRRAIALMVELAGGKATSGIVDVYPGSSATREPIILSRMRVSQVLGIDFGIPRIKEVLELLGFVCEAAGKDALSVAVPYWRTDVKLADDLVEEVARIIGYDEIPTTMLSGELPRHEPTPLTSLRERLQDIMVGCGMQEVINYSLTSRDVLHKTKYNGRFGEPIGIANPLSREQEFLRLSLRGGLLTTFAVNERRRSNGLALFEIGKVYIPRGSELPDEKELLAGVLGGAKDGSSWSMNKGHFDFFDAKGILETMFVHLGMTAGFAVTEDPLLIPGKAASVLVDGSAIGTVGELHPDIAASFDIACERVCLFELEVEKLLPAIEQSRAFKSIPRFPSIDRDVALLVDLSVSAQSIEDIIRSFPQVSDATVFDVYQGKQVPQGKKSLAFSLHYQSMERTLTDREVDRIQEDILLKLEREVGAVLRH